jgi:hypothetical protein
LNRNYSEAEIKTVTPFPTPLFGNIWLIYIKIKINLSSAVTCNIHCYANDVENDTKLAFHSLSSGYTLQKLICLYIEKKNRT